jgi:hypothetical protein
MGMLDRRREPKVGVAPPASRRGVAPREFLLVVMDGVSSTRRRNCWLFIVGILGEGYMVMVEDFDCRKKSKIL